MMKRVVATLVTCLLCMVLCKGIARAENGDEINESCIVSVAIDVSGSMKRTDAKRDVPETIKMILDVCDDNDYFSVVAYNDQIAYYSGLISTGDAQACAKIKQDMDNLVYAGNTDNGLGLMHVVREITDFQGTRDRGLVILISDGNTDLVGSNTGRNADDSKRDIEESTELAKENDVPIYVIEYTDDFTTDTTLMSIAASATGGGVTMVDERQKFVQVMLNSFFAGYNGGKTFYETAEADVTLNRAKFESIAAGNEWEYFLIYSWERIADAQVIDKDFRTKPETMGRYLILETSDRVPRSTEVVYSLENKGTVMLVRVKAAKPEKPVEPEVITVEKEKEIIVTPESAIPVGKDKTKEVYSSSTRYKLGASTLFEDDDIVSYELKDKDGRVKLEEGLLSFDVSEEGKIEVTVVATDAVGNTAKANVTIRITPAWMQYQKQIIIGIIAAIVLITAIICFVIIRKMLFHGAKPTKGLSGELMARFVDIKSKNDIDEVRWKLKNYPPDGVSLGELFRSKGIREELKDIDKVCFYPGDEQFTLQLIHCIEGGVFIGDHHVRSNVPTIVRNGNKIYVSIAENASEIELTYFGK